MCGIIGMTGTDSSVEKLVEGLQRMEYRGYDSWGVAALTDTGMYLEKKVGPIGEGKLSRPPKKIGMGIAHTRWATHGGVTKENAHPHLSKDGRFVVAQNGIVENYLELKALLEKRGYRFQTPTDTEAIVHLIHFQLTKTKSFPDAVRLAFLQLTGRNTIIVLDKKTRQLVAVRNGSPLVLGHLKDGVLLASDTLPLSGKTKTVTYVDDFQMVVADNEGTKMFDVKSGRLLHPKSVRLELAEQKVDRGGYDHFMLKEIVEQQHTILEATNYTARELAPLTTLLKKARRVFTVGAGTAALSAGHIARYLRTIAALPALELRSYEIDSFLPLMKRGDVLLAVSQSGETADTLEAVHKAAARGVTVVSIVNMIGSTLSRMSVHSYLTRCGPEICVASTKAYTAQVAWGYLLAMTVVGKHAAARTALKRTAGYLKKYFASPHFRQLQTLARIIAHQGHCFVIGTDEHYYSALEAALKIKEITYKHFEGFSAGELKHGVIALIEEGVPVFGIVGQDERAPDILTALAEVKAREALVVGVGSKPSEFFDVFLETADAGELDPVTKIVPFQLLSYYLGVHLGNNPDKPRNLAKSVTVK